MWGSRARSKPCGLRPAAGRSVRAGDHLSARLGHRPLRFPLRLLHVGGHDVPAEARSSDARGARPGLLRLRRATGVRKLRITGGEPLVRRDIMTLFRSLSRHLETGALDELTVTTNGSQLSRHAARSRRLRRAAHQRLARHPRRRQNSAASRAGATLPRCWRASTPRRRPGLKVKINTVALKGVNEDEIETLLEWAHGRGMDLTLIEVMPLGEIDGAARRPVPAPVASCGRGSCNATPSTRLDERTGGPARYVRVEETGGKLGFITPMTHNFCESCNRVRLTCTGQLFMCLGQEDAADLRTPVRASESDERARCRHRGRHRAQAEGPRFHHRPPPQPARRRRDI